MSVYVSIAHDLFLFSQLFADSSAAIGVCNRKGLGKVRHLDTNLLWVQDRVGRGDIKVQKVHGEKNPADALTKHVDGRKLDKHMDSVGRRNSTGRHGLAPELN